MNGICSISCAFRTAVGCSTSWAAAETSMATNKIIGVLLFLMSTAAGAREAASPASCQAAAAQPAIADTKVALDRNPTDLPARFKLADAWSDAGCFNEALQVLQSGRELHPESKELETRMRVARSLVGEEAYFDN